MQRGAAAGVAIVVLALGALGTKMAVDAARPKGSDQEQLARMLVDAESAVERGDVGGVTRYVSPDYRDNLGLSATSVKYQISDYIRKRRSIQLTIPSRTVHVTVNPDGRTGSVQFHLSAQTASESGSSRGDMDLSLQVRKERVYYYLVFPGEEWRVTSADGYSGMEGL